jgi:hypothetical protein
MGKLLKKVNLCDSHLQEQVKPNNKLLFAIINGTAYHLF